MDEPWRSQRINKLRALLRPSKQSQPIKISTKCLLVARSWSSWLSAHDQYPEDPWPLAKDLFERRIPKPGQSPLDLSRDTFAVPMKLLPILIDIFGRPGKFLEAVLIQEPTDSGLRQRLVDNPVTARLQRQSDSRVEFVEVHCDPEWTVGRLSEIIRSRIVSIKEEDGLENLLIRDAIMKYGQPFLIQGHTRRTAAAGQSTG
jgi:hypothetical protein